MATFPNGTVVQQPARGESTSLESYVLYYATTADNMPMWGSFPAARDRMLREFWPTESVLASALFSTISKYTAFGWTLDGPERTVNQVHRILHGSEHGTGGWHNLMVMTLHDLFEQDNGAFIETVRTEDRPDAPVVQLNHLDSARCVRTGRWQEPVIYLDLLGKRHLLKWYQVMTIEEFPSAKEEARGLQYCVVTRLLKAAQILRDLANYKHEKVSGRFVRAIHLVSGVGKSEIDDAIKMHLNDANNQGLASYIQPLVVSSIDPTANVTAHTIEMASLPEGFDEETTMRWYVNQLALAFGADYQDFAPLPGGNLGSAHQAEVLHLKSRGKGPALFMRMLEHKFNFHGIMPATVKFRFGEQDVALDEERAKVAKIHAETLKLLVESGIIDARVARQILRDRGDLEQQYLALMGEEDLTPGVMVGSSG